VAHHPTSEHHLITAQKLDSQSKKSSKQSHYWAIKVSLS